MDNPHSNETNANKALGNLIKQVMHGRETQAEHTRKLAGKGNQGKAPDIVITATGRSPVVIEAKWMHVPENEVQEQARQHVGKRINGQPHPIEAAIALRYPNHFATADDIHEELKTTRELRYCAVYPKGKRFPTTGWLKGSVSDLADLIHLVDVPETAFQQCAKNLEARINEAVSQFPRPAKQNLERQQPRPNDWGRHAKLMDANREHEKHFKHFAKEFRKQLSVGKV